MVQWFLFMVQWFLLITASVLQLMDQQFSMGLYKSDIQLLCCCFCIDPLKQCNLLHMATGARCYRSKYQDKSCIHSSVIGCIWESDLCDIWVSDSFYTCIFAIELSTPIKYALMDENPPRTGAMPVASSQFWDISVHCIHVYMSIIQPYSWSAIQLKEIKIKLMTKPLKSVWFAFCMKHHLRYLHDWSLLEFLLWWQWCHNHLLLFYQSGQCD